ncbi:OprD family outer membrane porin [Burkholderia glumae]|uniref:OprD family outer membrane porin n=1 Tax=Burkholderia glumae TaxID=337 RepID=UPI00148EDD74|nr:OprD family outer membrane porin [Burkholderia glumae]MCQ0030640.1 OprD family porin [Burkholderia glumae]MCQ0037734.1 OprD family porin [Burkholderia glumae]QJW81348.1 OprD family porin [Burkholderia glumae]
MTQIRNLSPASLAVRLAYSLPVLAGMAAAPALADEPPAAPRAPAPAVAAQPPTTPPAVTGMAANQAGSPVPSPDLSSQAKSQGFVRDSHLQLMFRNYADLLDAKGGPHRHAWVQALMANFESGYTTGLIGFGVDASAYAALKLDGGAGGGNMVHVADGGGSNQLAWAYPGLYDVKARISNTVIKYGLQIVDNPFMEPHDNRALPPTFLGATIVSNEFRNVMLEAGSFTKTDARGRSTLIGLRSQYGGTRIDRLSYAGGTWDYMPGGTVALYANQAENVWNQYYASVRQSFGVPAGIKWSGFGNVYSTHDTGDARQGGIDNQAYSLSLAAQHGPHELLLGYQQVLGNQFFDYLAETNGIFLADSMDVDYNAPHEKSLQLRYTFYGKDGGLPGFKAMVWALTGWGADGSAGAAQDPTHAGIYWKDGLPVQGRHHEFGFIPSYTIQGGRFKDTRITFVAMWHVGSAHYSDSTNQEYRLVVNLPMTVF